MKNVLIINGHQYYEGIAEGRLTSTMINKAKDFLEDNNFSLKYTHIQKGYDLEDEIEKFKWADTIIFQHPIFWSVPWLTKKYLDEVFEAGRGIITYTNDGRSRDDASKKYGSGGLMKGKKYMLSLTYNCPSSEFDNEDGFFQGMSVDQANFSTHYIFKFCGAQTLKTYSIHDIFKGDLDIDTELNRFEDTLRENFNIA